MGNVRGAALVLSVLIAGGCDGPRTVRDGSVSVDAQGMCATATDCEDGIYCNGEERCEPGASASDARGCVAGGGSPCAEGRRCSEIGRLCYTDCAVSPDADGDGFGAPECGGADCDDADPLIHPGAPERCNGADDDCDGAIDEDPSCTVRDAGVDAGRDAGADAGHDAGVDAGRDAGVDAGRDAGVDAGGDAGLDGGSDASPDLCGHATPGAAVGAACAGSSCAAMACQAAFGTITPEGLDVRAFPGGMCGNGCDPDAPDSCGSCGTCNPTVLAGRVRYLIDETGLGVCRADCIPTRTDRGGCVRTDYACDVQSGTCMEACIDDTQCRYVATGTGVAYDASSTAFCNTATGRCSVAGLATARAGDPCANDAECMDDGVCLGGAWGGYCASLGCAWPDLACRTGEICDHVRYPSGVCLDACSVGAEPVADRLGAGGHGSGCAAGFSCAWDGASAIADDPNGSCIPGEYNAITTSNVGAPCTADSECYSPFGYGRCMFLGADDVPSGICTIDQCYAASTGERGILPGIVATGVCDGASELCVDIAAGGPARTVCLETCVSADSCAPGYACAGVLAGVPDRVCWPNCDATDECRAGEACLAEAGGACGPGELCSCTI